MDLPKLAEDGCNWQTYSSWVLKAISEDSLMGHLDGSETRPTTPKLLQEYGARWTPRTNEERDVVTAWKTADNVWHQRAAMAHQFIIYGLPDSILMLCMHLDTPREAFAYLEYRYGQIPRPEIQKTVDEAVQQHDMPSEQYMTGESAQSTCDSDNGPENLPGGHEDPVDSPNDCAETESGFLTPKTKVTDAQLVEPHLLVVEVGAMDSKWLDEGTDAPKAPDEGSQCVGDKVEEGEDLPKPSSEAHEPQGDLPDTTSECAETQTGHRKPENEVVDMQQMVDVLPMFEEHEAPDEGGQHADNKVEESRDLPKSSSEVLKPAGNPTRQAGKCSMEDVLQTPIEDYQHAWTNSETIANVPDPPSTHAELPTLQIKCSILQNEARAQSATNSEIDLSCTRRSDKLQEMKHLELDREQASRCPQRTHQGHSTCETPPDEVWGMGVHTPARAGLGDSTDVRLTATRLEIRDISMQTAQALPNLPHWDTTRKEPDKAESTSGGGDDAASKDILDSRGVKKTSLANSGSQQGEQKTRWRNSLPAPPETPPNGFIHPPRTLTDRYWQEMERRQGSSPVPPAPPPNGTYYIHKSSKGLRHRARLKSNAKNKSRQAKRSMAVQNQSTWESLPSKEDNGSGEHDDAPSSEYVDPHGVEKVLLTDSGTGDLPAPSAPSPNGILDMPTLFMDLRRHVRVKSNAENVSNAHTRQSAYLTQTAPMQPPLSLFAPMKWFIYLVGVSWMVKGRYNKIRHVRQVEMRGRMYQIAHILMWLLQPFPMPSKRLRHPMGGLWIMEVGCSKVGSTSKSETRGHMHHTAGIYMQLPQVLSNPSKRLRNVVNTYWRKGVPPGSIRNDAKRQGNVPMAIQRPRSSGTRGDIKHRAERLNDLLTPSKPARYDHPRPPRILKDPHLRSRIKTRSKNVSTVETRGGKASRPTFFLFATSPARETPLECCKHLLATWDTPRTNAKRRNPIVIRYDAPAAMVRGETTRAHHAHPEMAVATTRSTATATTRHLATLHGLEAAVAAIILVFILIFGIQFSFEFYILHPYLITQWSFRGCLQGCNNLHKVLGMNDLMMLHTGLTHQKHQNRQ
ncbi:hypothetical protein F5141DRAFT_1249520 [Pisolithus sp. B1]|nr:hypothetical protein F5141DRAFT_1249520 [Pisolithus sp. B1]